MTDRFVKYNATWSKSVDPLTIELTCIQHGGFWKNRATKKICGAGLFQHYKNAQSIIWPEDSHNRWSDLILKGILDNTITTVMGPKSSSKTHTCAKYALIDFWAFPNQTTILMSSTDVRGLELRVWGELKSLIKRGQEKFSWLRGIVLESKHALSTDDLNEDDQIRDLRNGIICIPCLASGGTFIGLGKYVGIKNKRVRLVSDEVQFMKPSFLDAVSNLDSNPDFKAVFLGNPIDPFDPLGKAAEPENGWGSLPEPDKTSSWKSRFMNGLTINLVGTDSPNFDYPQDQPPKYPYLINKRSIESVISFYGLESSQYYSQCKGVMKTGLVSRRVITNALCQQFGACNDVLWDGSQRTKIYAIDAAYGNIGGDRCVGIEVQFGREIGGKSVIWINKPFIIPVNSKEESIPEDQIAYWVKTTCEAEDIKPSHVFFDATGRGSLGTSFARIWSPLVNPIEFGGQPTARPVTQDMFIFDSNLKVRRLKLCNEHYSKFVTELWYSVRYAIEAGQVRGLCKELIEEGCMREWKTVRGNKIEIETKSEMKDRMGRSPDLFDALAIAIEGARRLGFSISKMSNRTSQNDVLWIMDLRDENREMRKKHSLVYQN